MEARVVNWLEYYWNEEASAIDERVRQREFAW
jgi:hypothetical protein